MLGLLAGAVLLLVPPVVLVLPVVRLSPGVQCRSLRLPKPGCAWVSGAAAPFKPEQLGEE